MWLAQELCQLLGLGLSLATEPRWKDAGQRRGERGVEGGEGVRSRGIPLSSWGWAQPCCTWQPGSAFSLPALTVCSVPRGIVFCP